MNPGLMPSWADARTIPVPIPIPCMPVHMHAIGWQAHVRARTLRWPCAGLTAISACEPHCHAPQPRCLLLNATLSPWTEVRLVAGNST